MITFKEFLAERVLKNWEYSDLDEAPAFKLLNTHCLSGLESIANGSVLFRGVHMKYGPYSLIDSSTGVRTSKDTNNFYQLMMDNSAALKEYPSRSKSFICSTSYGSAKSYGDYVYAVFPYDGTKIAVSSKSDFIGTKIAPFGFGRLLQRISTSFVRIPFNDNTERSFTSIDDLNKLARSTTEEKLRSNIESYVSSGLVHGERAPMLKFALKHRENFFTDAASMFFTPEKLKLKLVTAGSPIPPKRECWFSGKAVFLSYQTFEEITKEMKKQGMPVASKYK